MTPCACRTDEVCGHYAAVPRRPPELDDYGPPSWTAVAVSWVVASVAIPLAAVWYPYDRVRAWLARRKARR